MEDRLRRFPAGATVTEQTLDEHFHETLAWLRGREPVSWVPALGAWIVTSRELAVAVMRDAETFTVDDPRFSTAQVLGPSMLSLDGADHERHRRPFADTFRAGEIAARFAEPVARVAADTVAALAPLGRAELRRDLAGPLAVRVMATVLELADGDPATLLGWYDAIVAEVAARSDGRRVDDANTERAVEALSRSVRATVAAGGGVLAEASGSLSLDEVGSNTGVLLFGGIETSEGMIANLFAHLLGEPDAWRAVAADRSLIPNAVDESLRLEPSVVRVDRYATRDVVLDGAPIEGGDFVIVSLAGANRDPAVFPDPDRFDVARPNARQHLTFAHGPHACLGIHLARLEARCAVEAALDLLPGLRLDQEAAAPAPLGTVFRKPDRVDVVWTPAAG